MAPSIASAAAVTLQDVSVNYGDRRALFHVTVTFPRGATGLLGANGAGKTSLIQAILGLRKTDAGHVEVLGVDVSESPLDVRARIGYMPERDAFIPGFSAIASVAYCGELGGLPSADAVQRAHEVLSYVGLDEGRYRDVETFSIGMKQRLKLAQALVHDPDLLLLDEPTNGMDPKGHDDLLALIVDLSRRHRLNVIVSSHLLPDIERTCDSAVVLNHGVLAGAGSLTNLRVDGSRTYELRIKGDRLAFVRALTSAGIVSEESDDDPIVVVIPEADPQVVFGIALQVGAQIRHFRQRRQTLEDIFIQMTEPAD